MGYWKVDFMHPLSSETLPRFSHIRPHQNPNSQTTGKRGTFHRAARDNTGERGWFGVKVPGIQVLYQAAVPLFMPDRRQQGVRAFRTSGCCLGISRWSSDGRRSSAGRPVCHLPSPLARPPHLACHCHTTRDTGHSLADPSKSSKISEIPSLFHVVSLGVNGIYTFLVSDQARIIWEKL